MNSCFLMKIQFVISRVSPGRFLNAKARFYREDKNSLEMYGSFPFIIFFLAQVGHDEFEYPLLLHISHIREVVILEGENKKKKKAFDIV